MADRAPRFDGDAPTAVTVLSQKEIETVAVDPSGRLRLVDDIAGEMPETSAELHAIAQIRSRTAEIASLREAAATLDEQAIALPQLLVELQAAVERESALAGSLEDFAAQRQELAELSSELSTLAAKQSRFSDIAERIRSFRPTLESARRAIPSLTLADAEEVDPTTEGARVLLDEVREHLDRADAAAARAVGQLVEALADIENQTRERDDSARLLRQEVDTATAGAGDASEAVTRLRSAVASLEALANRSTELETQIGGLVVERGQLLDQLEVLREDRSIKRSAVTDALTQALQPRVRVRAERYGSRSDYENAIITALRGSRLHHSQLAPAIANSISPRELVKSAEESDPALLVEVVGLDRARAQRVLDAISASSDAMLDILATPVDDDIRLELLDGSDYKPSDQLSTGQRCTVVLPILLEQLDRILIMDQPEDHLDNAFVTDTVVKALRDRGTSRQSLIATHNANIPVLGDAELVIVMQSDGTNGFAQLLGSLEDEDIVEAITDLMEGGREAFQLRAQFYGESQ